MQRIAVNLLHVTPTDGVLAAIGKPYRAEDPTVDLVRKICISDGLGEKHGSVLEHVVFTFDILGVSRGELQEHMRHRISSPTVESSRFSLKKILDEVKRLGVSFLETPEAEQFLRNLFVFPDTSVNDPKFNKLTLEQKRLFEGVHRQSVVSSVLSMVTLLDAEIPNDLVKYCMNESFRTNFTWTVNLRSLLNFLRLRYSESAHFEIRYVASLVYAAIMQTWVKDLRLEF